MKEPPSLFTLQGWFMERIVSGGAEKLDEHIRGSDAFPVEQRIAIYTEGYQARLIESLESEFPVLKIALGESLFRQFATEYLRTHPPSAPCLADLGAKWPDFLKRTRPRNTDEQWPDFIIDLATLERTFTEVYRGPGIESQTDSPPADTESILAEASSRQLDLNFPVHLFFLEARMQLKLQQVDQKTLKLPESESVSLLIFRRDYKVLIRRLTT